MKAKNLLLLVLILISCNKFSEDINTDFISYKDATILDFDTEFPVINIELDQIEFDEMYANFEEDIEIEGFLNLYRNKEQLIFDELVEVEIKGAFSATFELKSLGIKFDDSFKEGNLIINPKKILPNHSLEEIKAFRLRNSGNDFKETLLKDISYTQLAINAELNLDLTYSELSIVFVNKKFFGVMNLRSEGNTNGISRLRDEKKKNITLAKINNGGEVEKKDGDFDRIDAFLKAIEDKDLDFLKTEVDIDNFIDYMIFQTYIANVDWPDNNIRFYSVKEDPFRFVMYDLDFANTLNIDNHPIDFIRTVSLGKEEYLKGNPIKDLFNILYSDQAFETKFNTRYLDIVNSKVLSTENFNAIINANYSRSEKYMPMQLEKYPGIGTMIEWYRNIELLKENFKQREDHIYSKEPLF